MKYFRDIVNAACVLYDYNITHRDIKAQNILIKDGVAKLADFGFAKELREKDVQEDGTGVGTILYMAPQLILQDKPQYSIRCDVWSIGVILFILLSGSPPFGGQNDEEIMKRVEKGKFAYTGNHYLVTHLLYR